MKNNEISYDFFDKYSEKMFSAINKPEVLIDTLRLYTKIELNVVRKELRFPGLCNLNKEELAVALERNIKKYLSEIVKKFTERELFFIKDILRNNGILQFKEEFIKEINYLRGFGILGFFKNCNSEKYLYIPNDIISDIDESLLNMNSLISVKENESTLAKGNILQQILSVEKESSFSLSLKSGQTIHSKIGRNAPCPCGSGKKFKFCCLQ